MNQRTFWVGFVVLLGAVAVVACDSATLDGAQGSAVFFTGMSGTGSSLVGAGGKASSAGAASAGATMSSGGTAGLPVPNTGGMTSLAGTAAGGAAGMAQVCTDKQHPDHQNQPCSIWSEWDAAKAAGEPKDCDASWLTGAGYCLESCGKCKSAGSGGSGSGSASGSGGGGAGGGFSTGLGPGPNLPNVTGGTVYWASRYWDCCKTHCATNAGAKACGSDGVSSNNSQSACNSGQAYACYSEAPRAIGDNVSYGHVAVPNPSCNACYHLQFTGTGQFNAKDPGSVAIAGKHMIVKVSNTGGDVASNQFDLMIPGGGVGQNTNTCPMQWGVANPSDLGAAQGGFVHYPDLCFAGTLEQRKACVKAKCELIPAGDARKGCLWWADWFQLADNPNFRYEPIACPSDI